MGIFPLCTSYSGFFSKPFFAVTKELLRTPRRVTIFLAMSSYLSVQNDSDLASPLVWQPDERQRPLRPGKLA